MAGMPIIVNSVTPSTGPSAGSLLVEISGGGFQLPPAPDPIGLTTPPPPTVRVTVGGRVASDVRVIAQDLLTCIIPAGDVGPADVVVQNLDPTGEPIPGQQGIGTQIFSYFLQPLTIESELTRLVRTLLQELKRQVLENVVLTVEGDFDEETGEQIHLAPLAKLPGLVLIGPELTENRFYSINKLPERATGPNSFDRRREPYTVDVSFTLVGLSDHTTELINMLATTQLFFHRNKFLSMQRDPANPSLGAVSYELDLEHDGDLKVTSQPNESNLRSFSGKFLIRGFDIENLAGLTDGNVVERGPTVDSVQLQDTQHKSNDPGGGSPSP